jgi:hypothetical protein
VEQAARVGVRQAVLDGGGVCPGGATKADVEAYATSTGAGCNTAGGGDAACYLHQAPMSLGTSTNLTVTATCLKPPAAPLDPTWQVQVQADFPLAYGFFKALFPQSTRTTGWVKYTATATSD